MELIISDTAKEALTQYQGKNMRVYPESVG